MIGRPFTTDTGRAASSLSGRNRTKGAARRGNRTGRLVYPAGTQTVKVAIILSRRDYETARACGKGYAPAGIRALIQNRQEDWEK